MNKVYIYSSSDNIYNSLNRYFHFVKTTTTVQFNDETIIPKNTKCTVILYWTYNASQRNELEYFNFILNKLKRLTPNFPLWFFIINDDTDYNNLKEFYETFESMTNTFIGEINPVIKAKDVPSNLNKLTTDYNNLIVDNDNKLISSLLKNNSINKKKIYYFFHKHTKNGIGLIISLINLGDYELVLYEVDKFVKDLDELNELFKTFGGPYNFITNLREISDKLIKFANDKDSHKCYRAALKLNQIFEDIKKTVYEEFE